jgi:hypothetical protein
MTPNSKMSANWESTYPPKTSSRYGIPAIYLNLEVGLSFSSEDKRTHSASMKYASKRMEEKLHEQRIRQQYEEGRYSRQHPAFLMPANGTYLHRQTRHQQQQQRQRRLGVNTREQHERGTSAPPTTLDRAQPLSPVSPLTASPDTPARTIPLERTNQPLPPTPSQFRLGEADMPWSVDPVFVPNEPVTPRARYATLATEEEKLRLDDPKHNGADLEALHLAMMTVDSLNNDAWEPPSWGSVQNESRASRSIGWAISSDDAPAPSAPQLPPYTVGTWDSPITFSPVSNHSRPRTAST